MADNVVLPLTGAGDSTATAATDDVGGVHYPIAKLADGTLGNTTPIASADGVAANAMRVTIASDGVVIGPVNETAPGTDTASSGLNGRLQRIAQRLTSLIALLPTALGQSTMANSFRVVLASDQTVIPVSDNGGSLTVDGSVTANAGTNLNTSALALESGGNLAGAATSLAIIDDWDESDRAKVNPIAGQAGVAGGSGVVGATTQRVVLATDVGLPSGTSNIGDVDVLTVPAPLSTTGGGTEAAALRVTLANDSTGLVSVDDNGGSLTVDGTVTANAGTGTRTVAGDIAHDAADTGVPVGLGAQARTTNPTAVADADRVRLIADDVGRLIFQPIHARDLLSHQHTQIASSSSETTVVAAGGSGVFNDIVSIMITNQTATAVNATLKDSTGGTTRAIIAIPASGGAIFQPATIFPQLAAANNNWTITLSSAAVTVNIAVLFAKNV